MIKNKNVQILSIDAKDLVSKNYSVNKNSMKKGSLDYSMETDEIRELGKTIIKVDESNNRYYTYSILNVTFKYKIEEKKFVFQGDISNGNKVGYRTMKNINTNKNKYDKVSVVTKSNDKNYIKKEGYVKNKSVGEIRKKLYREGFYININGKIEHFVRYKRTSGSARVGKCLFINEKYYKKMIDWSFAGIKHDIGTEMDCAGMEAYISLPTSSSIGRFNLKPENILLIDDATSTFTDTVMATKFINEVEDEEGNIIEGDLFTDIDTTKITNKIFDGESLLDKTVFEECGYEDKAILQIRNIFYKGIGINTNIQGFFRDNNITKIEQLNGKTIATDISQIKLITTPSSVKYLKFGTFENWLKRIEEQWAICKYEKPQHHFNGMVQTHYQLLNTLGMSKKDMSNFLQDTINYIKLIKTDTAVFKYHLGINSNIEAEEDIEYKEELGDRVLNTTNDFILSMLEINDNFINTKICKNFRNETIKSYIKNVRHGHVLVEGNYSVLVSCPYEYLLHSIGKFNGESLLKPFECISSKFKVGEDILGVRSPEPTMSNITIFKNNKNKILDKYFNTKSKEVIYISPIDNNIMELLSSCDFDGDALLLTNNNYLVEAGKKLQETIRINNKQIKRFLVSTDFTPKSSIKRHYTPDDLADTDIKCSSNKIGEIINLAQMLNSVYWDKKFKGCSEDKLLELYKDISNLNILSCIEIDRAKKISPVNAKKELDKIREKHNLGKGEITRNKEKKNVGIRPKFFKYLDGGKDYKFNWFNTGMDYLEKILDEQINRKESNDPTIKLHEILDGDEANKTEKKTIDKIKKIVINMRKKQQNIWDSDADNRYELNDELKRQTILELKKHTITLPIIYTIMIRISKSYESKRYEEYKSIGKLMLNTLYECDKIKFLKCIKIKNKNISTLIKDENGNVVIYGQKFNKKYRFEGVENSDDCLQN
jgi:hypothetical protein